MRRYAPKSVHRRQWNRATLDHNHAPVERTCVMLRTRSSGREGQDAMGPPSRGPPACRPSSIDQDSPTISARPQPITRMFHVKRIATHAQVPGTPCVHCRLPPYCDSDVFREVPSAATLMSLEQHRPSPGAGGFNLWPLGDATPRRLPFLTPDMVYPPSTVLYNLAYRWEV